MIRQKVILRNFKWEPSIIPPEHRAEKYGQRATLVLVTGARDGDRKAFAKDLEARLFVDGHIVYFLGMATWCTAWTPTSRGPRTSATSTCARARHPQ